MTSCLCSLLKPITAVELSFLKALQLGHRVRGTTVRPTQVLIKQRDRELKDKTDIITKLQERVLQQSKDNIALDRKWDDRVQQKEEGYGIQVPNFW